MSRSGEFHPEEMISAYLDGELGPEERALLEEHLGACPRCAETLKTLRSLSEAAAREEPPDVPVDLAPRIRRRVEEIAKRKSVSKAVFGWRPLSLVAAALAVATLVWVAVRREAPVLPPAPPAPSAAPALPEAAPRASLKQPSGGNRQAPSPAPAGAEAGRKEAAPGESLSGSPVRPALPGLAGTQDQASPAPPQAGGGRTLSPGDVREKRDRVDVGAEGKAAGDLGRTVSAPSAAMAPSKGRRSGSADFAREETGSLRERVLSAAQRPRTLLYETSDTTVTVSEDGTVTLVVRGYACSVNVLSPAPPGGTSSLPRELASLFQGASSREMLAAAGAETHGGATAEAQDLRPESITLQSSDGGTLYAVTFGDTPETVPPTPVQNLKAEILRTVYSTFRKDLEDRCGPVP